MEPVPPPVSADLQAEAPASPPKPSGGAQDAVPPGVNASASPSSASNAAADLGSSSQPAEGSSGPKSAPAEASLPPVGSSSVLAGGCDADNGCDPPSATAPVPPAAEGDRTGSRASLKAPEASGERRRSRHEALETVVDALAHINSPSQFAPPAANALAGARGGGAGDRAAPAPVLETAKSKKLHLGSSHQAYTGLDQWLDNYGIDIEDLGPNFQSGKLTNAHKLDLATYSWTQDKHADVKGAVVLFHSYTSHALWDFMRHQPGKREVISEVNTRTGERETVDLTTWVPLYSGSWVEAFWKQGFNVYAMDHQSHGRSAGWREWRCNVEKFDHLVDDALQFIKTVVAKDPVTPDNVPIYVLGYSMGGNITLQTLARIFADDSDEGRHLQARVRAAVLLAPMLRILLDRKTAFLAKLNKSVISCCMPNLRLGRSTGDEAYAYLDRWYEKDPFAYGGSPKSRMIANLYSATIKANKVIRTLPEHLKVLCLQGTGDATVDYRAALLLAKTRVRLDLMYLTGWSHYLAKQIGFELLRDLVAAWVHAKLRTDTLLSPTRDSFQSASSGLNAAADCGANACTQTSFEAFAVPPPTVGQEASKQSQGEPPCGSASAAAEEPDAHRRRDVLDSA
ncbi:hypothetical protein BESB_017560 [Besnoitia besnoiti]|uniref:Serine aminopeptidase S33 domain-containing protein n=1 Tax=Besnoitia besnoiti TaxID=94643 RepID=A0A2A9M1R4_BESBE|nr:hypothetical protein BESB_017560 [Besnoitia besnoiti]PFH32438.1 hypothetical protein BESB_017560 [Besnoitia besnoiti]